MPPTVLAGDMSGMDGDALILCEGRFGSGDGKTAHGLVRFTRRYRVRGVIDSTFAGRDVGLILDGWPCGILVVLSFDEGLRLPGGPLTHLIINMTTIKNRLPTE